MKFSSSCEKLFSLSEGSCSVSVDNGMENGRMEFSDVFTIVLLPDTLKTCFFAKYKEGTTQVNA